MGGLEPPGGNSRESCICATLMTASSVSISGLAGWVGLVIPHLARMISGPDHKTVLPVSLSKCGRTQISADDLMRWDPDVIIMMSDEGRCADRLYTRMKTDPFWSALTAVRKGRYYEPPAGMYHWLDRPSSINRIIGLIWLMNLLYPYHFDWDMVAETRTFYQLFYRLNLSSKQAEGMLGLNT